MLGVAVAPPGARFHGSLPDLGAPIHIADYADGFKTCTYAVKGDPAIGTDDHHTYRVWQYDAAYSDYRQKALPDQPRPLYRPENLEAHPDWPLYVLEREEMVDAFHALSGDTEIIATTVPGGCAQFGMGDWGPLMTRERIILWPTSNPECVAAFHELGRKLQHAGAKVSIIVIPQEMGLNFSFTHIVERKWTWSQVQQFISVNRMEVEANVVPIGAARSKAGSAPPTVQAPDLARASPKLAKQDSQQVRTYRDTWASIPGLAFAPNGTPYSNAYNVCKVLERLEGRVIDAWYDDFHCKVMTDTQNPRAWEETDTLNLLVHLQGYIGFSGIRDREVMQAVRVVTYAKPHRHEVRDWLNILTWDGLTRCALLLPTGYGTVATPYMTSVGRCFLMAAVARVVYPGCQCDYVPIFEGRGDLGKTSSLMALFGTRWFDNPSAMMGDKDFLQNMPGKWCLELGELANLHGRALEIIKATITRRIDLYRAAYGRIAGSYPRQCVFAGTIDRKDWNSDQAGGRRWWPVECGKINVPWIEDNREQLFAEAHERIRSEEPWHNVPVHDARDEQRSRQDIDALYSSIERYLVGKDNVTFDSVLRFGAELDHTRDWTTPQQSRVKRVLAQLGWEQNRDHTWRPRKARE